MTTALRRRIRYRPVTQPGQYVPTAPVVSAGVGTWTPWVMASGSQFRAGPPPSLTVGDLDARRQRDP